MPTTTPQDPLSAAIQAAVDAAIAARWDELLQVVGARPLPKLLDGPGVRAWLDITDPVLRRLRDEGMPFIKLGDAYRYDPGAVMAWLSSRK